MRKKILFNLVLILLTVFILLPDENGICAREDRTCAKGLLWCAVTCAFASPVICGAWCFAGYAWCKTYVEPNL